MMMNASKKPFEFSEPATFKPIAIVGQSCILPGALSPEALWQAVRGGKNLMTAVRPGEWGEDNSDYLAGPGNWQTASLPEDKSWSGIGGRIEGFDSIFDPTGFNLEPDFVKGLDPLFQWLLHTGREALQNTKIQLKTGAIIGNLSYPSRSFNLLAQEHWFAKLANKNKPDINPINRFMSGYPAHLLSNALGLRGPSFCIDAACASSLYAIKLACDSLHRGEADLMLAGGVNGIDDLFLHVGFTALSALSPSGQSRPFHQDADGLVPAKGAALVALKRLEDAEAAGEEILGVIRGIGLSNDGKEGGLLAPSSTGQIAAMEQAYRAAGISVAEITLLECHATGTPLGDMTELMSLKEVYRGCRDVPVGSLKSNLGHLVTAAGAAALLKVLGAIKAGERPVTISADSPLPVFNDSQFRLLEKTEPWDVKGTRKAAISAFGFGGNNAHIIVEEYKKTGGSDKSSLSADTLTPKSSKPVAIVGIGMQVADLVGREAFAQHWFSGESRLKKNNRGELEGRADSITLDAMKSGVSPNDLKQIHGQQLIMMAVTSEALAKVKNINSKRTGAFIGMGTDSEVTRYVTRLQVPDFLRAGGINNDGLQKTKDGIVPALNAVRTLGCMPNIVANRLSVQYDFRGPGFTFSSEELSGIDALKTAIHSLSQCEIETAVVGAVDMSCEEIHQAVASKCLPADKQIAGDAAVTLILKTLEQAKSDGDQIFAVIDQEDTGAVQVNKKADNDLNVDAKSISNLFGHAHAASGLLQVAAGALSIFHNNFPGQPAPIIGTLKVRAEIKSFSGHTGSIHLVAAEKHTPSPLLPKQPRILSQKQSQATIEKKSLMMSFPAHEPEVRIPNEIREEERMKEKILVPYGVQIAKYHQEYIRIQTEVQARFLQVNQNIMLALATGMPQIQGRATQIQPCRYRQLKNFQLLLPRNQS